MIVDEIAETLKNSGLGNPHDLGEWVDVRKEMPEEACRKFEVLIRQDGTGNIKRAVYYTIWLYAYSKAGMCPIHFAPCDRRSLEGQWRVIAWLKPSTEM